MLIAALVVLFWLLLSPVVLFLLAISGCSPDRLWNPKVVGLDFDVPPATFERTRWAAGAARDRIGMAKTLIRDRTLIGKTRPEVIALIGPPDMHDWWMLAERDTGLFPEPVS